MFALKDILELLDRWPSWKKIQETPAQIEALENRVVDLEKRLARCPGEGCPRCGELSYRTVSSEPYSLLASGIRVRTMKCEKCGFTEEVHVTSHSSK
jgi:hypothetical protein